MDSFKSKAHSYQKFAVEFVLRQWFCKGEPSGLALDPGLGKSVITLESLHRLFQLGDIKRALIVAPLRPVYEVWPREIEQWECPLTYANLHSDKNAIRRNAQIEIINYEGLSKLEDQKGRWDAIILDESNRIKTFTSKRMKYLKKIAPSSRYRCILNGTPVANSIADLFSQAYFLDGGQRLGKTLTFFRSKWCVQGGYMGRQWVLRNKDAEQDILSAVSDIMLRMDAESYLDMPELVKTNRYVSLPEGKVYEYNKLKRDLFLMLESGQDIRVGSAAAAYSKLRQFASGTVYRTDELTGDKDSLEIHDEKLLALEDLADELCGKTLLTFHNFRHDYDRARQRHIFRNAPALHGNQDPKEAARIIERWNRGEIPYLFAHPATVSHGLNLQKGGCADVAWLNFSDSPDTTDQANRRIYRQGQKHGQVRIHRIITRGTIEQSQIDRVDGKLKTQAAFLEALIDHAKS